jgi:putative phosphotransacetylase
MSNESKNLVPVGVSNRHAHLSQADLDTLFGEGYQLTIKKDLSQPGQYACDECVDVWVGEKSFPGVRILGPVRRESQVEVSASDARKLRANPPVRNSGDLDGSQPCKLVGPKGEVELSKGMIIANRHIHMTPEDAAKYNVKDKDVISVRVGGEKGGVFDEVMCRVNPTYAFEMHIDTDDAAAFMLNTGDFGEMLF